MKGLENNSTLRWKYFANKSVVKRGAEECFYSSVGNGAKPDFGKERQVADMKNFLSFNLQRVFGSSC